MMAQNQGKKSTSILVKKMEQINETLTIKITFSLSKLLGNYFLYRYFPVFQQCFSTSPPP